ncbi:MAG: methyltransferase [Myxococcota bacterium]|nr:methyltransferase [Myxococcota bacterium]
MDDRGRALVELGEALREAGYEHVPVTPVTHARVLARPRWSGCARTLRDVFGWSMAFEREGGPLPASMIARLERAGALAIEEGTGRARSRVRFATVRGALHVHSAYPTSSVDSVFFGPDTYRFVALLDRTVTRARRAVDVGTGSGAGGLSIAARVDALVLADVSDAALEAAQVNLALQPEVAPERVSIVKSDVLSGIGAAERGRGAPIDLVIANPPYMADSAGRSYRDGGGELGTGLAVRIVSEALPLLAPGGRLVLYTGAPIVDGRDVLREALRDVLAEAGGRASYEELDPDVFGEELEQEAYRDVERIAAVALIVDRD